MPQQASTRTQPPPDCSGGPPGRFSPKNPSSRQPIGQQAPPGTGRAGEVHHGVGLALAVARRLSAIKHGHWPVFPGRQQHCPPAEKPRGTGLAPAPVADHWASHQRPPQLPAITANRIHPATLIAAFPRCWRRRQAAATTVNGLRRPWAWHGRGRRLTGRGPTCITSCRQPPTPSGPSRNRHAFPTPSARLLAAAARGGRQLEEEALTRAWRCAWPVLPRRGWAPIHWPCLQAALGTARSLFVPLGLGLSWPLPGRLWQRQQPELEAVRGALSWAQRQQPSCPRGSGWTDCRRSDYCPCSRAASAVAVGVPFFDSPLQEGHGVAGVQAGAARRLAQ